MTESNLSDKIEPRMFDNGNDVDVLFPKDVKEFIKKLKDWFDNPSKEVHCSRDRIYRKIDELTGKKLNGN